MKLSYPLSLLGLAIAFLLVAYGNETLLKGVRLDLTENQLYTLSPGSLEVIDEIPEPLQFYFFFSESASRELTSLRGYAAQVEALLREYEVAAEGKIQLKVIDPEPFSEDEDLAAEFGLQSVPVNNAGDTLYFGLAASNAQDQQVIIPFFQPDKEAFLEYDLSRTIQTLSHPELPKLALLSSLKIEGDINMQTFQTSPPWMLIEQLEQRYEILSLAADATEIPEGADLLVLVHPQGLSDATLYGIDQFVMAGGRLLVFLDPWAEQEQAGANPMFAQQPGAASNLLPLLQHWGIEMVPDVIVADADAGLSVGASSGAAVRHIGILGLDNRNFDTEDIVISGISSINTSSAGVLRQTHEVDGLNVQPMVTVGPYAAQVPTVRMQTMSDPEELMADFVADGEMHHMALRLSGSVTSAFSDSELAGEGHLSRTNEFHGVIVADTDLLSDRLWVQVQNFFGQRIASPFAGNGDWVFNLVDNLVGSSALISIRGRGVYSRPFEVVQALRREAEEKYLQSADELQQQLLETEARLSELSAMQASADGLTVTPEQEAELLAFQQDKLRIRKQLREVRHQLDKDIEDLGSTLKFLNILLVPILLTLGLMMLHYVTRSTAGQRQQSQEEA